MEHYLSRGDFVSDDKTRFREAHQDEYGVPGVVLQGGIACLGNLVLTVNKFLEILSSLADDNPLVETRYYRYNLSVRSHDNVFRYDNDHPDWLYPGHRDPHHKHLFDWRVGNELRPDSPKWIGADNWPHLSGVIDEAQQWYYANMHLLPEPHAFPDVSSAW
jgi:hypothetical protein